LSQLLSITRIRGFLLERGISFTWQRLCWKGGGILPHSDSRARPWQESEGLDRLVRQPPLRTITDSCGSRFSNVRAQSDSEWKADHTSAKGTNRLIRASIAIVPTKMTGILRLALQIAVLAISTVTCGVAQHVPMTGSVFDNSGQPVSAVSVTSNRRETSSDKLGVFSFEEMTSPVLHFRKSGWAPLTVVAVPGRPIIATMSIRNDVRRIPSCGQVSAGSKGVGWGKYGLHFDVPKNGVDLRGGKPDVDYVRYVVASRKRNSFLQLWFGPYSLHQQPDDRFFADSENFSQRDIVNSEGLAIGLESRGVFKNGQAWHWTVIGSEGANYDGARPEDVQLFDRIVDSVCRTEYPKSRTEP
jgi:hypothetical protein